MLLTFTLIGTLKSRSAKKGKSIRSDLPLIVDFLMNWALKFTLARKKAVENRNLKHTALREVSIEMECLMDSDKSILAMETCILVNSRRTNFKEEDSSAIPRKISGYTANSQTEI